MLLKILHLTCVQLFVCLCRCLHGAKATSYHCMCPGLCVCVLRGASASRSQAISRCGETALSFNNVFTSLLWKTLTVQFSSSDGLGLP